MKNKQLALISRTQALKLRDVGFDWPCPDVFEDGKTATCEGEYSRPAILRPTVALALKWMREVKNIVCGVQIRDDRPRYDAPYIGVYERGDNESFYASKSLNHTHEATESALLDELLTIIDNQ